MAWFKRTSSKKVSRQYPPATSTLVSEDGRGAFWGAPG